MRERRPDDEGSLALYMAIITVALMAMLGLVLDGGAALAARGKAATLAQEAARAGANALAPDSLRATSPTALRIDPIAARAAATRLLTLRGVTGEATVNGLEVTVVVHVPAHAVILSAVGVTDLTGTAAATATVLHGTATGGP